MLRGALLLTLAMFAPAQIANEMIFTTTFWQTSKIVQRQKNWHSTIGRKKMRLESNQPSYKLSSSLRQQECRS